MISQIQKITFTYASHQLRIRFRLFLSVFLALLSSPPSFAFFSRLPLFSESMYLRNPSFFGCFPPHRTTDTEIRKYICLITESDSCDTEESMKEAMDRIQLATQDNDIDILIIRVSPTFSTTTRQQEKYEERVVRFTNNIADHLTFTKNRVLVMLSSEWRHVFHRTNASGIHFKESHRLNIPEYANATTNNNSSLFVIGTSAHSITSALEAWNDDYPPNYFVVGTCYPTLSHPEKIDVEGPELPGQVRAAIQRCIDQRETRNRIQPPAVLAVGGIDTKNCHEPVQLGAQGVAVIRSILYSSNPAEYAKELRRCMDQ